MIKLGIFLFFFLVVQLSEGRKCWFCQNARSNTECIRKGHLQQCLTNQKFCQNEIRAIGGGRYFEVTKRCKQSWGCDNNERQNISGRYPFQCQTEEAHSVCRCCCGFDNCNGPEINCLQEPPQCPDPDPIIDGVISCSGQTVGSRCIYRCRPGYKLEGNTTTVCEMGITSPNWSSKAPKCVVKPCRPLVTPDKGTMVCSDDWNIGSDCEFGCEAGRVLVGKRVLKCSHLSIWTDKEPECKLVDCFPPRPLDPNLLPKQPVCTDRYQFESECAFSCHPDYTLRGAELLTCGLPINARNKATWDNPTPRCEVKTCEPQYPGCDNIVGAICTRTCDDDCDRVEGLKEIECTRNGWTGELGTCVRITCRAPPGAPDFGGISCEPGPNLCGKRCSFTCDTGYQLSGRRQTECLNTGEWSNPTPQCNLVDCFPPTPLDPNLLPAQPVCTNTYQYNSVCQFACHPDYDLRGEEFLTCGLPIIAGNKASWDYPTPRCQVKTCQPPYPGCDNIVGATCSRTCDDDCDRVEGLREIECTRNGWTGDLGTCVKIACSPPPSAPDFGSISCEPGANLCGKTCTFACDTGYQLNGQRQTECLNTGEWSNPTPICELRQCPLVSISNINAVCSGRTVGDRCELSCDRENQEFIGETVITCEKEPTDPVPTWKPATNQYCRDILCPNFPNPGENPPSDIGSLTCGTRDKRVNNDRDGREGWKVDAQCQITCVGGYQPLQLVSETNCNRRGTWTENRLCCVRCVENPSLDIVVFLDMTEGESLRDIRADFLMKFMDELIAIYQFNLNITFIPFGDSIDLENRINFKTYDDFDNPLEDSLVDELKSIPLKTGEDSNYGRAMQYAIDDIFGFHDYRVPMIFMLTSKAPSDVAAARSAAKQLHEKPIHLRFLPIVGELEADPGANLDLFMELTENDETAVVTAKEEPERATDFYIAASENLITFTIRLCNEKAQATQRCIFEA